MLALTAFEFIVRAIPEAFAFILGSYALSNTKINMKRYIISGILLATCIYSIRMLPINYGIHTILNIIIETIILININKIDVILAIKSSIITTICLFVAELLNMLALNLILKEQLEAIMSNIWLKTISGLPSLGCLIIIVSCYYYYSRKKDKC